MDTDVAPGSRDQERASAARTHGAKPGESAPRGQQRPVPPPAPVVGSRMCVPASSRSHQPLAALIGAGVLSVLGLALLLRHIGSDPRSSSLAQPAAGLALLAAGAAIVFLVRPAGALLPPGVLVNKKRVLVDALTGQPLPRGLKLSPNRRHVVCAATGGPMPPGFELGPGGVLMHRASGRPVPHSCSLSEAGLLSSSGEPLPASMHVGPNCVLLAADGTPLSPDLQPVPPGFVLSHDAQQLLRPNGKPVPRGVHVGPGFRLTKPSGENLPDGVKIGPAGTLVCLDGAVLGSDGHALPPGYQLSPDKSQILDPRGRPLPAGHCVGPNCTLIAADGGLSTILGAHPLPARYGLGPLGGLLLHGAPVPPSAAWDDCGQLMAADGRVLDALAVQA